MKIDSHSKINWIASLRGVAAFLVFFSHLKLEISSELLFVIGRIGVVCFFLMTGYLALDARRKRTGIQYLFNRLVRVYPIYWLILTILSVIRGGVSLKDYVLNLTLFQEFLGSDNILGASWMLPVQLLFWFVVSFFGEKIFVNGQADAGKRAVVLMLLVQCGACVFAILRHLTHIPFPTAFCLLTAVAILGVYYRFYDKGQLSKKTMKILISLFEIGLAVSVIFSYTERAVAYFVAYNIGILLFVIFKSRNIEMQFAERLGERGMAFFLGADIAYYILFVYLDFGKSNALTLMGCVIQFVLTWLMAGVITKYFEIPMLNKAKNLENKYLAAKKQ